MDSENLAEDTVQKVLLIYIAVAVIVFLSGYLFQTENEYVISVPVLLSVLLVIPIYMWCRTFCEKTAFPKEIDGRDRSVVLSWILALFVLALSVRVPSVLFFGMPYEKTPLIYLVILTILVIEKVDVSAFGFKM
ncbi:hypothetical protein KAU85_00485, partial [Candidatus Bathyarchaeota archaeon]|nr:hypothetical protein [Candidatus Bathyarchaeota archaeon]